MSFVIVRWADLRGVKKTDAIRSAVCQADHRLIASDTVWKVRPRLRKVGFTKSKLNCKALHNAESW